MDDLFVFARFHADEGKEDELADALDDVIIPTRLEPGCKFVDAYRSVRDPRLFFIHSARGEAAFETHATQPRTKYFIERVQALIDHSLDINRTQPMRTRKAKTSRIGFMDGRFKVPDDFDTMMADEIEKMFYGKPDK